MAFRGWPPLALEFYRGLETDNSKAYWLAHKDIYERDVKAPMIELLDELTGEFGDVRLFRPYRDTRFSPDKSPYKTAIAALVGTGHVHLSAQELRAGAGLYHMEADQLERFRSELERVVGDLRRARLEVYGTDALKRAPQGYPGDHPRVELLRYKGIVVMKSWPVAAWLGTPAPRTRITELFHAAAPLTGWLSRNVGASAQAKPLSH